MKKTKIIFVGIVCLLILGFFLLSKVVDKDINKYYFDNQNLKVEK